MWYIIRCRTHAQMLCCTRLNCVCNSHDCSLGKMNSPCWCGVWPARLWLQLFSSLWPAVASLFSLQSNLDYMAMSLNALLKRASLVPPPQSRFLCLICWKRQLQPKSIENRKWRPTLRQMASADLKKFRFLIQIIMWNNRVFCEHNWSNCWALQHSIIGKLKSIIPRSLRIDQVFLATIFRLTQ